jgi:hypothetical protein
MPFSDFGKGEIQIVTNNQLFKIMLRVCAIRLRNKIMYRYLWLRFG